MGKVIVRSKGIPREDTSRTLKPGRKGRRKGHCVMLRRPRRWRIFLVSYTTITSIQRTNADVTKELVEGHPRSCTVFWRHEDRFVSPYLTNLKLMITQNIVKSVNQTGIASLVVSGIATSIAMISVDEYLHLVLASISTQSSELVQKVLPVLHECRGDVVS